MKSHKNRRCFSLCVKGFLFAVSLLLTGCGQTKEPKTILLPQTAEEKKNGLLGEQEAAYTVQKIYTQSYEGGTYRGYTAFLSECKEHQVYLLKRGDDGESEEISVDYRYGFYEPRYTITDQMLNYLEQWWDNGRRYGSSLLSGEISPDGRYLTYLRSDQTYTGDQLFLLDLETGEEAVLLDGDAMDCPSDQFQIMTAWDMEDSLLCYGFYPVNADAWMNTAGKGKFILHYLDLEKDEEIQILDYSDIDLVGKASNFYETRLYVDREEDSLLTAIVSNAEKSEGVCLDLFAQEIPKGNTEWGIEEVIPESMWYNGNVIVRLDAGRKEVYSCYTEGEQGAIVIWNISTHTNLDSYLGGFLIDFLVLDEGETIITAEIPMDQEGQQEICLYTRNEDGFTRHLLYKGNGNIVRLQYDPVYRRLLAELGNTDVINGEPQGAERGIVVLEFE